MRTRAGHWSVAMATGVVIAAIAAVALGVFALAIGRVSTDDVRVAVGELRARAAEAKLLADRAAAGDATAAYTRAQSLQLVRAIGKLVPEMAEYATKIPTAEAKRADELAPDVLSLTQAIGRASGDPASLQPIARELEARVQALDAAERALERASR